jgi:hypothetical protein
VARFDAAIQACTEGDPGETRIARIAGVDQSTISRWLNGKWDTSHLHGFLRENTAELVAPECAEGGDPLFLAIDDTTGARTCPRKGSKRPMDFLGWLFDHVKGEHVYGYNVLAAVAGRADCASIHDFWIYGKGGDVTKNAKAAEMVRAFEAPGCNVYVLGDRAFTCQEVMEASIERGFNYIGAAKSSLRITVPSPGPQERQTMGLNMADLGALAARRQCTQVFVHGKHYLAYGIEGVLESGVGVKAVLSWPVARFGVADDMRAFVSTDTTLSAKEILAYYRARWKVETFFKEAKCDICLKNVLVRTRVALERMVLFICLAHQYTMCGLGVLVPHRIGAHVLRVLRKVAEIKRILELHVQGMDVWGIARQLGFWIDW